MIHVFVGAGGKSSLIRKLANQYRAEGKKVFVTTTTHMFIEEDTILSDDAEEIIRKEVGLVFATVLEHAGVYKTDDEGRKAFMRFVESV